MAAQRTERVETVVVGGGQAGLAVGYHLERRNRPFVILDAGMTELIRPMLYDAYHRIEAVLPDAGPPITADIVGPLCESSDTLGRDRTIARPRVGDLMAVRDAGAYGSVMASNYNRRPMPPEVLVDGGTYTVIRRRQTIDDLVALES